MRCSIININTKSTDKEGALSFFEEQKDIPFETKRFYYIYGALNGIRRGGHAHKKLKQLLFCPYGSIKILLDDVIEKREIILDRPDKGLLLEEGIWRDMIWQKDYSVLCVAASELYDEEDYIRDYSTFVEYVGKI